MDDKQADQPYPTPGTRWRHRNGARYTILHIANLPDNPRYPQTVVYMGDNAKVWARPLSDWARSMTYEESPRAGPPPLRIEMLYGACRKCLSKPHTTIRESLVTLGDLRWTGHAWLCKDCWTIVEPSAWEEADSAHTAMLWDNADKTRLAQELIVERDRANKAETALTAGIPAHSREIVKAGEEPRNYNAAIYAPSAPAEVIDARAVAEAMDGDAGRWKACCGCYETCDGHPVGNYPYSAVLKCDLGGGCRECGGLGAIWDTTDYADMGDCLARGLDASAPAEVEGLAICDGCGCTTTDA